MGPSCGQSGRLVSAALIASRTRRFDATSLDWRYPANTSCIWNEDAAIESRGFKTEAGRRKDVSKLIRVCASVRRRTDI